MSDTNKVCFQSLDNPDEQQPDLNAFLSAFDAVSKLFDCGGIVLSDASKKMAVAYAKDQYFGRLTKSKYSSIIDNLRLVYGDTYVTKKDVRSFHLVESNIIQGYLGIQNLDKLFDEDFFDFEWDIHTQQDFSEHRHGYQRDHFVHQIRNLWMLDTFLDQYGFYNASRYVLGNESISPVSKYVSIKCQQMLGDEHSSLSHLLGSMSEFSGEPDKRKNYQREFFYKYVIYGAAYLSALFHDLGYPVVHFLSTRRRLSRYSPASYMFTQDCMENFDMIANKLNDSLLFTIESAENIRKNMKPNKNGKYDHGVYSAIPFLLHFYESGLIYRLAPEKTCAIELAAVAIYNHNLSLFACTDGSPNPNEKAYYQPYFNQNPISFLLKACDDLQEWDRRYFEITGKTDIMFCPKCHCPMMKVPYTVDGKHRFGIDEPFPRRYQYKCVCGHGETEGRQNPYEWMNTWPTRQEDFLRRKIYLIRACDSVTTEKVFPQKASESAGAQRYMLQVSVNYDLYRLLMLSRFSFADYRINDLKELKRRLFGQNYRYQCSCADSEAERNSIDIGPEGIYIDYFLSSNPITIKVRILEKWLSETQKYLSGCVDKVQNVLFEKRSHPGKNISVGDKQKNDAVNQIEKIMFRDDYDPELLDEDIASLQFAIDQLFKNSTGVFAGCGGFYVSFWFYLLLLMAAKWIREAGSDDEREKRIIYAEQRLNPIWNSITDPALRSYTGALVHGCFEQYRRDFSAVGNYESISDLISRKEEYEKCCESAPNLSDTISKYCYGDAPFNMPGGSDQINFFHDLYLFYVMNEEIKSYLKRAYLSGADLAGADLHKADLTCADLTYAVLTDADLRGADLFGADLRGANLTGAHLRGANSTGADLRGANLSRADLRGANLTRADLRGASLLVANLRGTNLFGANLFGADLRGADLRGADLRGPNLLGADLRVANLRWADLRGANLRGAILPDGFGSVDQLKQVAYLKDMNIPGLKI